MPELQPLCADHASAVLAFELVNRGYFAASISDRGDEFFDKFTERLAVVPASSACSRRQATSLGPARIGAVPRPRACAFHTAAPIAWDKASSRLA